MFTLFISNLLDFESCVVNGRVGMNAHAVRKFLTPVILLARGQKSLPTLLDANTEFLSRFTLIQII
ncbi:MAG: hypothetical protein NVS3B11_06690 [Collimonas sp.]